jgi:hypothetical protein
MGQYFFPWFSSTATRAVMVVYQRLKLEDDDNSAGRRHYSCIAQNGYDTEDRVRFASYYSCTAARIKSASAVPHNPNDGS